MQTAKKIESEYSAVVIDFKTRKTVQKQLNIVQNKNEVKSCFRSGYRYYCNDTECGSWNECQKLVAAWMR